MMSRTRGGFLVVGILLPLWSFPAGAEEPAEQGTPAPQIDYVAKLNELVRKGSDESQNAEPFYQKAFDLCVEPPGEVEITVWPTELPEDQRGILRKWVEANSEALAQLRLGTEKPSYWFQYGPGRLLTKQHFSDMPKARLLTWALVLRAKFKAAEGQIQDAMDDALASCRLGVDMRKRPLLAEQLVGVAITACALRTECQILAHCHLDRSLLETMQNRLIQLAQDGNRSIDLKGEEFAVEDTVQGLYAKWLGGGVQENTRVFGRAIAALLSTQMKTSYGVDLSADQVYCSLCEHTPQETTQLIRRAYEYYHSVVSKTPFQWRKEVTDFEEKQTELIGGNPLLSVLAPDLPRLAEMSARCRAQRDGGEKGSGFGFWCPLPSSWLFASFFVFCGYTERRQSVACGPWL